MGVPADRIPAHPDDRARLYRSVVANRKLLLFLDDAAAAAQVRPLLPGRSALVLVTSRDLLADLVTGDGARAVGIHAHAHSRKLLVLVTPDSDLRYIG